MVRFSVIIRGLLTAILLRHNGGKLSYEMMQAINHRVMRAAHLVRRLGEALAKGVPIPTRRSPVPRATEKPGDTEKPRGTRKPPAPAAEGAIRLPRNFAWMTKLVGTEAAAAGSQLRALMEDPEMAALLAASPRMVRTLKPLCRMLGANMPPPHSPPPRPPKGYVAPKVKVERPWKPKGRDRRPSSPRWPAWPAVPGAPAWRERKSGG